MATFGIERIKGGDVFTFVPEYLWIFVNSFEFFTANSGSLSGVLGV